MHKNKNEMLDDYLSKNFFDFADGFDYVTTYMVFSRCWFYINNSIISIPLVYLYQFIFTYPSIAKSTQKYSTIRYLSENLLRITHEKIQSTVSLMTLSKIGCPGSTHKFLVFWNIYFGWKNHHLTSHLKQLLVVIFIICY